MKIISKCLVIFAVLAFLVGQGQADTYNLNLTGAVSNSIYSSIDAFRSRGQFGKKGLGIIPRRNRIDRLPDNSILRQKANMEVRKP